MLPKNFGFLELGNAIARLLKRLFELISHTIILIMMQECTAACLTGKNSTCSEECFSLARLNLIRQSCVVLRETFVQLGKSFPGGATIPASRHTPQYLTGFKLFTNTVLKTIRGCSLSFAPPLATSLQLRTSSANTIC